MAPRRSSRVVESDTDGEGSAVLDVGMAPAATQTEKGWQALSEEEQDEYAGKIVRHFLMRHSVKAPVKRADLTKALFAPGSEVRHRQSIMKEAFKMAQESLQNCFSCDIVEVVKQVKGGKGASQTQRVSTATQRAADGTQTQVSGAGQKGYILVSTADSGERRVSDDSATRAFLAIIASIILLTPECRIEEGELERALRGAAGINMVESGGHKQLNGGNVRELVTVIFIKQWYLEREKEDRNIYYYMGPRLRAELDDDSLLAFVTAVYNHGAKQASEMDPTMREEFQYRLNAARGLLVPDKIGDE